MRYRTAALLALISAAPTAWAQAQNTVAVPPPPPLVAAPLAPVAPAAPTPPAPPPPPGLVQTPMPPYPPDLTQTQPAPPGLVQTPVPASPPPASPAAPAPPDLPPAAPDTWVPGHTATLGVLDKVDGSTSQVSIPVGGQANIGDLQVSVQSCLTRPPGQIPDVAIFLTTQASADNSGAPLYRGWMLRSTPGATVVGDAGETFRVIGCS